MHLSRAMSNLISSKFVSHYIFNFFFFFEEIEWAKLAKVILFRLFGTLSFYSNMCIATQIYILFSITSTFCKVFCLLVCYS